MLDNQGVQLGPGERVIARAFTHGAVFFPAAGFSIIALLIGAQGGAYSGQFGVMSLLLAGATAIRGVVTRRTTELLVSDQRVLYRTGLVRTRRVEFERESVRTVRVLQTLPGRILDYGTVEICSEDAYTQCPDLAHPHRIRDALTSDPSASSPDINRR